MEDRGRRLYVFFLAESSLQKDLPREAFETVFRKGRVFPAGRFLLAGLALFLRAAAFFLRRKKLTKMTFAIALHTRLRFILAENARYIFFVQRIIQGNQEFPRLLEKNPQREQYKQYVFNLEHDAKIVRSAGTYC
jgi:hypothetical protein